MRAVILAAMTTALVSCATPSVQQVASASPLQKASFSMKSWGRILHQWTMDDAGRVEHLHNAEPFGRSAQTAQLAVRRVTLSTAQQAQLADAIDRVRREMSRPEGCDMRMTDGPYGDLSWTIGGTVSAMPWNGNCTAGRDHDLSSAIMAADKIVDDAAKSTPVVENRQVAN